MTCHNCHIETVKAGLGLYDRANHAQIVKLFSTHLNQVPESYSPAKFVSVAKDTISGMPDLDRASTSHVERKNGTLRQWCKRLTRLTYAFSKNWANLQAALALHFWHYNFCRVHSALRITPAMGRWCYRSRMGFCGITGVG
jgi:hypothetical protein